MNNGQCISNFPVMIKHRNQKQLKGRGEGGEAYFSFQFQRERMTQPGSRNRNPVDHIFIDTWANRTGNEGETVKLHPPSTPVI